MNDVCSACRVVADLLSTEQPAMSKALRVVDVMSDESRARHIALFGQALDYVNRVMVKEPFYLEVGPGGLLTMYNGSVGIDDEEVVG